MILILRMVDLDNILISILTIFTIAAAICGFGMMIFEGGSGLNLVFANNKNNKSDSFWKTVYRRYYYCSGKSKKIFLAAICVILSLLFYLLFRNFVLSMFIGICLTIFIASELESFKNKRKNLLHKQLIEFINNMMVMLKAGRTVRNILKDSTEVVKDPLRIYLNELVQELELNFTLDCVLENFSKNCKSKEVNLLVGALEINNRIGGDLIFILGSVAGTLQHSLKFKSQIKTMTLQSRYSGNIISFFPILVLISLFIFAGDSLRAFFSTGFGTILFLVGGCFEIAGILAIKNIIKQ